MTKLGILVALAIYALSPLWLLVLASSASTVSANFAMGCIAVSCLTLVVTGFVIFVRVSQQGILKSKFKYENQLLLGLLALAIGAGIVVWLVEKSTTARLEADWRDSSRLVLSSDLVSKKLNGPFLVFKNYTGSERNGSRRLVYSAFVKEEAEDGLHVVVDVFRGPKGRKLAITCVLSREEFVAKGNAYDSMCTQDAGSGTR